MSTSSSGDSPARTFDTYSGYRGLPPLVGLLTMQQAATTGLTPRDMSIATFDDLAFDHSSHPHLTVVVQPSYEMGARAANLLIDRIEGRMTGDPITVRVVPTLVTRESTAPPKTPVRPRRASSRS